MTLAEIRVEVERHLAMVALSGANNPMEAASTRRFAAGLLRAHLQPRCTLFWYGEPWLFERLEAGDLIFHRPRAVITLGDFLLALRRGGVRDAPASEAAT